MSEGKYLVTGNMAKFVAYGRTYEAKATHPHFTEIAEALSKGSVRKAVTAYNKGLKAAAASETFMRGNDVYHRGVKLPEAFAAVHQQCAELGYKNSAAYLNKFLDNITSNPSGKVSIEALSRYLMQRNMPLTDNGTFLAYKKVNRDFTDCHTGAIDNSPGKVVSMRREDVDPVQTNTCSTGLHVCSYGYLREFSGDVTIVVEVNPKNVVAVPPDYNNVKMRCCEYRVLCTLDDFKKQVASHAQDVLGTLPLFKMGQMDLSKHEDNGNYGSGVRTSHPGAAVFRSGRRLLTGK